MNVRRLVLVLAVSVGVALASTAVMYNCEQPLDPKWCQTAFIVCPPVDDANCSAAGGQMLYHGGVCNVCDICVTTVGWGQRCNYTTDAGAESRVPLTHLCDAALVCSGRFNGTCRRPQECL